MRFVSGTSSQREVQIENRLGATVAGVVPQIHAIELSVPGDRTARVLTALSHNHDVRYAEPTMVPNQRGVVRRAAAPNDEIFSKQWNFPAMGILSAWDQSVGAGIDVAVVDDGVDSNHPDLAGQIDLANGHDFVTGTQAAIPSSADTHGTMIAGIIAAATNNGIGVAGVAPSAKVMPLLAQSNQQNAKAIIWAVQHGAKVINLSWGFDDPDVTDNEISDAIAYATKKGALVTCAVADKRIGRLTFPDKLPDCMAVGATGQNGFAADFSNYGNGIDIVAPGVAIASTAWDMSAGVRDYGIFAGDGTSFATPEVGAVAALLMAKGLNRAQAIDVMESTAIDVGAPGWDEHYGWGRLDAAQALAAAAGGGLSTPTCHPIGVSANKAGGSGVPDCRDIDGETSFTYKIVRQPYFGTATVGADGLLHYAAGAKFVGSDNFTYEAIDSTGRVSVPRAVIVVGESAKKSTARSIGMRLGQRAYAKHARTTYRCNTIAHGRRYCTYTRGTYMVVAASTPKVIPHGTVVSYVLQRRRGHRWVRVSRHRIPFRRRRSAAVRLSTKRLPVGDYRLILTANKWPGGSTPRCDFSVARPVKHKHR